MNIGGILLALQGAASQGILWGVFVLGVYITYKILDIADLTVDGSFALGGCVCATLIVEHGMNPVLALVMATLAGLLAGGVTGFLHTVFEIPAILAGILTQISLWSINLRIMGKSNTPLLKSETIFTGMIESTGMKNSMAAAIIGLVIVIAVILILYWFFGTEIGSALRATGNNEDMIRALGVNTKVTKMIALMMANGLVGLSGGLVCQSQKYADIGMGTGAIVIGLAAIVIGEVLLGRVKNFAGRLIAVVVGSIVYFLIRAVVLQLGMDANDMKMLSAIIVALALCIPVVIEKYRSKRMYSEGGEEKDA
ncbi:ABC transporter permease [Frisingicoccus sp.]|uniref:ABC transporter permease n=1 Tax=Frisingicoccus sp. TaxID=1918627 RepID=UPI002EC7D10A|nr:ABC transporter permease [Frisingicoccus sp.]